MVRKTALVTAMLAAFANQAYAMGLGDIRLNSVLNQPFNAEIELLSPTAGDLAQLRVVLASPEAYGRAGVERAFFHTKLRFAVVPRPDGSAVIKVTSRDAVREPYLDFLVEATWGSGQVLREYTVLVDPPALMPAPVPVTRAPAVAAPPPTPAAAPAPAPRGATPAAGYSGGEYRTSRHDTLWRIAAEVRPSDAVSMEQTMLGLLAANPEAFYDQNINNLKAGYVLRVPGVDELAAVRQADALAEVRQQNRLWRDGRTAAAAAPDTPAVGDDPAVTDGAAAPTTDVAEPQLKLVAPEGVPGSGAEDAAGIEGLREELALASEAVAAERLQNQELDARVQQLEEQLATLNRLVELQSSELAQLGGTVTPMPGVPDTAPDMPADTATDSSPVAETGAETTLAGTGSEAPAEAAPGMEDAAPEQAPVESAMELADDTQAEESPAPAVTPLPAIEPAATDAGGPPAPAASQDEGLVASLLANPMVKWGAAGGALLVALFAWLVNRRRRMQDSHFQESILAERQAVVAAPSAAPVVDATVTSAPAEPEVAEAAAASHTDSSLFTDFAVSDMGTIQNDDEADPIAEADVYLAYGRYQQAEELVRSAMARAPERIDVRLKLFEILSAAQNSGPFDVEAEALLADLGDRDDETWKRVAEMGRELSPSNPLYQSGSVSAAEAPVAAVVVAEAAEPEPADEELAADNGLDFDVGDMASMGEQVDESVGETDLASSEAPLPGDDDNGLDFDLGEFEAFARPEATAESELAVADDLESDLSTVAEDDEAANEGTLTASDEVATKLDLARAYMEMGDPDGARGILQEVMEEGSDTQRSEAESLLQKVS